MTFILPSFGASAISAVHASGGLGALSNTYSVDLDGSNDYLDCGTVSALNNATDFTLSMWVNFQTFVANSSQYNILFGAGTGGANRFLLNAVRNSSTLANRFEVYFCDAGGASIVNTSAGLTTNTWYHMAVYKSGADMSFYINNSLMGSRSNAPSTGSGANFAIGRGLYNGSYSANILVDEVAVWDSDQSSNKDSIYNSGVPNDISSLNPTHWWRMGDNDSGTGTTVTDQGSGGNDGTLTNGPTFSTNVPTFPNTYSVDIDGTNDYIDCGGASDFSFTDGSGNDLPFSISAWVKFDNANKERLVSKDTSTSSREFLFGTDNANVANMILGTATVNLNVRNTTPLNLTDWFHIVSTYDGSKSSSGLKVYVNADDSNRTDVSTGSYSGMSSTSGNLEIGRFANGHSFFNGLIDEVAVFDYELSSAQVTSIYNSGVPNNIASLSPLGWWRMGDNDGGTGTTITDQGSGGNNGTLTNGPTFSTTVPS